MAKAVVSAAAEKGLEHEETHSKVEYIVAHGIASSVEGQKVVIGSYHFVFEDEACTIDPAEQEKFDALPKEYFTCIWQLTAGWRRLSALKTPCVQRRQR